MKLLLIALLLSSQLQAEFIAEDKQKHAIAGLAIYGGCVILGQILKKQDVTDSVNSKTCVLASVALGVGKELYDSRGYGTVDSMDAVATFAVPMMISYTIEF